MWGRVLASVRASGVLFTLAVLRCLNLFTWCSQDYKLRYQLDPLVKQEVLQKEQARVRATVSITAAVRGSRVLRLSRTCDLRAAALDKSLMCAMHRCWDFLFGCSKPNPPH